MLGGFEDHRGDDSDKRKDAEMEDQPAERQRRARPRLAEPNSVAASEPREPSG